MSSVQVFSKIQEPKLQSAVIAQFLTVCVETIWSSEVWRSSYLVLVFCLWGAAYKKEATLNSR